MTNRIITAKTHLPFFPGFYESLLSYDIEDYDLFDNPEAIESDILSIVMNEVYSRVDYKAYEEHICQDYVTLFMETIKDQIKRYPEEYGYLQPLVDTMKIEFDSVWSPREYNFQTDECMVNLTVDIDLLKNTFLNTPGVEDYLENTHKSREGFFSFYSHDIETWEKEYVNSPDKYYIVLWSMLRHVFRTLKQDIIEELLDDVVCNTYKPAYIDYDKLLIAVNGQSGRYYAEWSDIEANNYSILLDPEDIYSHEYGNIYDVLTAAANALHKTGDKDNHRLSLAVMDIVNGQSGRYYKEWSDIETNNYSILLDPEDIYSLEYGNIYDVLTAAANALHKTGDKDNHRLSLAVMAIVNRLKEKVGE